MGRVAGDEAKAAGPTRRALYSYPFERRTSYLLTFLTPSFHRLPRRCRIDDGHVPLASQPALSTVREFLIRSLAFFLPVSFFLPPPLPVARGTTHSTWIEKRKKGRIVYRGNFDLYQREGTIFSLQPFFSSLSLFLRLPPLPNWIPRSTA